MSRYIDEHRGRFGVEPICRTLDVSASAYYQRATGRALAARRSATSGCWTQIRELHAANYYAYGYRRMWKALQRAGESVGRDRVKRLMRAQGIQGAKRRGKPWRTTIADPAATSSPDLVNRDFTRRPARRAVAGGLHLRALLGGRWCSSASSSTSTRGGSSAGSSRRTCAPTSSSTRCGWRSTRREHGADVELIHHSDAGSQYTSFAFQQVLDDHHVLGSIGSVGDAYDNAMAESFVDTFKTELIADRVWRTRTQLELAIVEWVAWFNHDRLHESLGDIPPAEFETLSSSSTVDLSPSDQRETN